MYPYCGNTSGVSHNRTLFRQTDIELPKALQDVQHEAGTRDVIRIKVHQDVLCTLVNVYNKQLWKIAVLKHVKWIYSDCMAI